MLYESVVKSESKIAALLATKPDRRSKLIAGLVLNPDTRWK